MIDAYPRKRCLFLNKIVSKQKYMEPHLQDIVARITGDRVKRNDELQ
jgi:hypothetical protein